MHLVRLIAGFALLCGLSGAQDPFAPYRGFYVPVGEKAANLQDIGSVAVTDAGAGGVKGRVVPTAGLVSNFISGRIANGGFTFRTARTKGVSYEFDGRFLQPPPFPKDGKTVVLEGTLKTYRSGKPAGAGMLRLAASDGGAE